MDLAPEKLRNYNAKALMVHPLMGANTPTQNTRAAKQTKLILLVSMKAFQPMVLQCACSAKSTANGGRGGVEN